MPTLTSDAAEKALPEQATERALTPGAVMQYESRGAWIVAAHGDYDMHSITPLADALHSAAKRHQKVVLDASGVTFADSTFLNQVILAHQVGTLRVAAPSPQLERLLMITGVDTVLEIHQTVDDAVGS
ncbi:STAS domain-containing protein [Streptomyces sp. NPDC001595]|uniref:STAS domain-containing protein n=1 Tax=Streptomyces sp. NPDC001532 TaxID=3154520 RepID=UPI0033236D1A